MHKPRGVRCCAAPASAAIGSLALLLCSGGLASRAAAQVLIRPTEGAVRIFNSDMAILETQEVRKDLNCSVTPVKPVLGFDLRYHGGYDVEVPLKDLSGAQNEITILFRVTSESHTDDSSYFVQHVHVPSIEENASGNATLSGTIELGQGSYHVDWLMRDRAERVCSFYWDMDAQLPPKDKQIELAIPSSHVDQERVEQFTEDPPVARQPATQPLNIKILINFAPQNSLSAALQPVDTIALVSILRRISHEPQFGKFSVVAFNIQEQKVLYRQSSENRIDFPALGEAIHSIKLGTVDLKRLAQKHGDTEFLTDLITKEMATDDHPDALVFAGPKVMLEDPVPPDTLKPIAPDVDYPVFYMNYALNPQLVPWKDSISRAVKVFKGTEYTISRPRDLWFAMTEMVNRIVKSKHTKTLASVSGQP